MKILLWQKTLQKTMFLFGKLDLHSVWKSKKKVSFWHFLAILVCLAFFEKKIGGFFWNSKFDFWCQTTKFHFLSVLKNLNYLVFLAFFEKKNWGFFWNSKIELLCQTTKFHSLSFLNNLNYLVFLAFFEKNFEDFFEIQNLNYYLMWT